MAREDGEARGAPTPVKEEGHISSGLLFRQKVQFTTSLISPLACGAVGFFSKDVYILELGADVRLMGVFGVLLAIWGPLCAPLAGYCMERELLVNFFPWESWGRRAPWFLLHSLVMAVAVAAVYLPPDLDPQFLCWWWLLWASLLCWVLAVIFNCIEASRAELLPTKEERSEVEAVMKISGGIGNTLGILPQLLIAAGATLQARASSSAIFFVTSLLSLGSLPIFRLARQAYDPSHVHPILQEFLSLLRVPVCRLFMAYRFSESFVITLVLSGCMYYLTLVEGLSGEERSMVIVLIGLIAGIVTLATLPCWAQFFRVRRPNINTNKVCGSVCALGALAPVVLVTVDAALPSPAGTIAWAVVLQATWNCMTFWRCVAFGWLVDEDCQAVATHRREAVFSGATSLVAGCGRALATGCLINGLAWAGLEMTNCEQACVDAAAECIKECNKRNSEGQPSSVRAFMQVELCVVAPVFQLICAWLAYTYPVHGERLEAIYASQASNFGLPAAVLGKSANLGSSSHRQAVGPQYSDGDT